MVHQCVRCGIIYSNASQELLKGCSCGCKLFFFIKKDLLEKAKKEIKLNPEERKEFEKEILDILDVEKEEMPVILDFETIAALKPGKYEIDLVKLFNEAPIVFKLEEGKYVIDLASTFNRMKK